MTFDNFFKPHGGTLALEAAIEPDDRRDGFAPQQFADLLIISRTLLEENVAGEVAESVRVDFEAKALVGDRLECIRSRARVMGPNPLRGRQRELFRRTFGRLIEEPKHFFLVAGHKKKAVA